MPETHSQDNVVVSQQPLIHVVYSTIIELSLIPNFFLNIFTMIAKFIFIISSVSSLMSYRHR